MPEEIIQRILDLKKERRAIILAHNYQRGEVQDIADYVGDSLELSRKASQTDADVIVFCGVHFMAETAKILSPEKVVLLPDREAGCPMADMITEEQLIREKSGIPGCRVVCYVNSSAAVKAEAHVCCTSANAVRVVQSLRREGTVLFIPDQYLGQYVMEQSGRQLKLWPGYCPTHMKITARDIDAQKKRHPGAKVLVHPECRPDVIQAADEVLSTGGMIRYARDYKGESLIIGTETGILHRLKKENPRIRFIPVSDKCVCPNMKKTTLEKVLFSLQEMGPTIEVPEDIRIRALEAVENMLAI
ncbi:MAG: quinolinate synthase NadA [Deltaproteobacteria bacterium]|nr:quinolinate synthase NadA [Deltaproteobacteria bacterium]MBW2017449.1 quinolinate synthase NadA [Deltaproteobacteria bacterium]MBW2129602.1 quinolinate synthase NadA [Deltaproteobacteria bacterium]MBW2304282.1 quinolinate synthase NadA [Deltaproteobacteria bacterium]